MKVSKYGEEKKVQEGERKVGTEKRKTRQGREGKGRKSWQEREGKGRKKELAGRG